MIQFLRKTTKTIFYIFLGLSCVLFSFTLFLSSDQAKKLIISKSDSLLESTLDYSSLQLTWTPLPHLTIYNLQVENESLKFKSSLLSFDPDPRALFTEHFPVNALKITNPNLVIHRSLIPKNTRQPELNDQLTYPKTLLISLINSDLNLLITNGQVTLTSHNAPSYLLTDINLSQQSKHKEILRNFSALLPKFGLIKYTGHTQSANREFNSTIHFQSIPLSSIPSTATIQELERLKGKIDLKLNIHTTMAAVNKLLNQASLSEGQHLTPSQTSIIADGDLTISHLISPIETDRDENFHIIGDFSLKHNGNEFLAALTGHNISLDNVRNFAAPFQSISPTLDTISNIVRGGTVSTVTLSTRRKHFKNILKTNKWQIEGKVTNGRLHIPYPKMDLNQVNGTFSLEDNTLRVREATAFFQETSGTNCYLDMGFGLNSDIFHLSIDLNANLSTLPAILHQVLPHGEVRNTFHKLKSLRGTATGSLVVEHKDSHFNTKVDVSQFQLTGRHGELPY
ncbi:MAG: hypothetical protein OEM02_01805, partial [Desulfobulbaceae bacterium]|nr:hypothetical protein [Desulfobulbaceae bacterium]